MPTTAANDGSTGPSPGGGGAVRAFFESGIGYSACNEDPTSEYEALQPLTGKRLLCILGGGERFFNLLAFDSAPTECTLVDANRAQLHLFELKRAAFVALEHEALLRFLGIEDAPSRERREVYARLRPALPDDARAFWDRNPRMIKNGVIYQGRFERFMRIMAFSLGLFFGRTLRGLFDIATPEAQREYFARRVEGLRWRVLLWLLCRKVWFRLLSGDPCFYLYEGIGDYSAFFRARIERAVRDFPARSNFLLSLVLCGRYATREALPPCYRADAFERVRARLATVRVEVVCAPISDFLARSNFEFDAFSLSDTFSYLREGEIVELLRLLRSRATAGARVVARQLLTRYAVGRLVAGVGFRQMLEQEGRLRERDASFIWEFGVLEAEGARAVAP